MPGTTPELNLPTPLDSDDIEAYEVISLTAGLTTIDAQFSATVGHAHDAAHKGKPITSAGIASGVTLTSPHFTTPVIDSGGLVITVGSLTISAGQVSIGSAAQTNTGLNINSTAPTDATNRFGGLINFPSGASNNNVGLVLGAAPAVAFTGALFATGADVVVGTASIGNAATAGFLFIPQGSGTPTGVPNYQNQGWAPIRYDLTASKLWVYHAGVGWKSVAVT